MNVEHETGLELARKLVAAENSVDELYSALETLLADGGPLSDPVSRRTARERARAALASSKEGHDARVGGRIAAQFLAHDDPNRCCGRAFCRTTLDLWREQDRLLQDITHALGVEQPYQIIQAIQAVSKKTDLGKQAVRVGVIVHCQTCGYMKKPLGRSGPLGSVYCDEECVGYRQPPFVGSLWPGETSEDFGYPVSEDGTQPSSPQPRVDHDD